MEYKVTISARARISIEMTFLYLLKRASPATAKKFKDSMISFCKSLGNTPRRFARLETSARMPVEIRTVVKGNYRIYYSIIEKEVTILEISHASADDSELLKEF